MSRSIEFFVPCVFPTVTAQMKRLNHKTGYFFKSASQKQAESTIASIIAPYRPQEPISGAVTVEVVITWPWLKKHSQKVRKQEAVPHTSKPDADNIVKQLIDELVTWRFIENDQSVWHLDASKWWGDKPGIFIRIRGDDNG